MHKILLQVWSHYVIVFQEMDRITDDDGAALKDLELPEAEVTTKQWYNMLLICSTQVAVKSTDKPSEQKSTKQWAIQADLGDDVLNEFHSRIPRMAHKVSFCDQISPFT